MCVAESGGSVMVSDSAKVVCDDVSQSRFDENSIVDDSTRYVHKEKDFVSLLSSTPGQFVC